MSKLMIYNLIKKAEEADKAVEEAHKTGNYIKAKNTYQELYDLFKCELGEKHPTTLNSLNNLAIFYSDLEDYNKACELQNEVYNARKEILGEKHPDTLDSLNNLAITYSSLGDYNKACKLQNAVYNARKEILGENHPDTLASLNNLANSYSDLGDYNKALEMKNAVYNARKEILGETHPDTLLVLSNLLVSQIHQDKTDNEFIKNYMIAYFENINNLKTTAFSIKEVSSRRNYLVSFNRVYRQYEMTRRKQKK